jgi:hypothetical protein
MTFKATIGINNTGWYTTLDGVIGGEDVPYLG